jgi:hypothetical protein
MVNYSLGKIYKIVCNTTGKCYIGSTCYPRLCSRLVKHRCCYNRFLKGKYNYLTSFSVLEGNNYEIALLELYPCSCKEELHARERWYIEKNECVIKYIPTRTIKEYYQDNKEQIAVKGKKIS